MTTISLQGYFVRRTLESGVACVEFAPKEWPVSLRMRRFLIPEGSCAMPTDNPFLLCDVDLRLEEGVDECMLVSVRRVCYERPDVQKIVDVVSARTSGRRIDMAAMSALRTRLENGDSARILTGALEKNSRPLHELLSKAESLTETKFGLMNFVADEYLSRLNEEELQILNRVVNVQPSLCCFWYDFVQDVESGMREQDVESRVRDQDEESGMRDQGEESGVRDQDEERRACEQGDPSSVFCAPLGVIWDMACRIPKRRISFLDPVNGVIPIPRASESFSELARGRMASAVFADVVAGKMALKCGDLEYDLRAQDEQAFRALRWLNVRSSGTQNGPVMRSRPAQNGPLSPIHNMVWERAGVARVNRAICARLEHFVHVRDIENAESGVLSLLFVNQRSISALDELAADLLSDGYHVYTAAQSATQRFLPSTMELLGGGCGELTNEPAGGMEKLVILVAQKLSAIELCAALRLVTGLLVLVGDPHEHGPTIFRARGRGGGDSYYHLMEHYFPDFRVQVPNAARAITAAIEEAVSIRRISVSNAEQGLVRAHVKRIQKRYDPRTPITCAGDNAQIIVEQLNDGRPKFTRPLHLSDQNVDVDVVQVSDRFPVCVNPARILLREHPSAMMTYRMQYIPRGVYDGQIRKVYRQVSKTQCEVGDKLTKAVLNESGHDITDDIVFSAVVDGGCIESREVFSHVRVVMPRVPTLIHVAGPGSSLEDIYSSMKYADVLHVVLAAGEGVFGLNDLPPRRRVARNGLSGMLAQINASGV